MTSERQEQECGIIFDFSILLKRQNQNSKRLNMLAGQWSRIHSDKREHYQDSWLQPKGERAFSSANRFTLRHGASIVNGTYFLSNESQVSYLHFLNAIIKPLSRKFLNWTMFEGKHQERPGEAILFLKHHNLVSKSTTPDSHYPSLTWELLLPVKLVNKEGTINSFI